jgi:hypothetical protein
MTGMTWQAWWMRAAALSPQILPVSARNERSSFFRRLQI